MLRALLDGAAFPRKAFAGRRTLDMALRAVRLAAQRNRSARSARALPFAVFELGPQETPCAAAQARSRQICLLEDLPAIPLKDCDQSDCKCRYRQIGRREAEKLRQG